MKIIVESHIPYIRGTFEPYCEVEYLNPEEFTPESVKDADALVVRTRTRCNETLLGNSCCKFVGTATIGTDHIDLAWCAKVGIKTVSAPGCNAPAVAQYVLATIGHWMKKENIQTAKGLTLGVVGVGHVGSIIARWAEGMGFTVLRNDPPRKRNGEQGFVELDEVIEKADIITFHTPLTKVGEDKTFHICDEEFIGRIGNCKLLINSARGGIVDNDALEKAMREGKIHDVSIDCWEGEPKINKYLLEHTFTATPHIAGYSAEGKHRATMMMVKAVSDFFGFGMPLEEVDMGNMTMPTLEQVMASYNPLEDTAMLRKDASAFEALRNHYNLRAEAR